MLLAIVIFLVLVALAFDFINGFHDAANSIATVVSTRVLAPLHAVAWAAFFNFIAALPAFLGGELKVAATMGKGVIHFDMLKGRGYQTVLLVVFASLVGSIVWNLLTWWWGLPSSSSHALAGGMIGATLPALGHDGLVDSGIAKIAAFIVLSPLIGMFLGTFNMVVTAWRVRRQRPAPVDAWFRRLQLLSAAVFSYSHGTNDAQQVMGAGFSYSHGTNDAQKVMGIIAVILYGTIWKDRAFHVPWWVVLLTHAAIGLGTFFGGWRIVKTMGQRLTKLQPIGGFCAETGGGVTILALAHWGIPVSTTHIITGAIVGVGTAQDVKAVRWAVTGNLLVAWVLGRAREVPRGLWILAVLSLSFYAFYPYP